MTRILVVEDTADLAFGLRTKLEIEGYAVTVAEDGAQGLQSAREESPDLLILDLMLPEMSGFSVLKALRAEGHDVPVPSITTT